MHPTVLYQFSRTTVICSPNLSCLQAKLSPAPWEKASPALMISALGKTVPECWDKKIVVLHVVTQRHQLHVISTLTIEDRGWSAGGAAGSTFPTKNGIPVLCVLYIHFPYPTVMGGSLGRNLRQTKLFIILIKLSISLSSSRENSDSLLFGESVHLEF